MSSKESSKLAVVVGSLLPVEDGLNLAFNQSNDFLIVDESRLNQSVRAYLTENGFQIISSRKESYAVTSQSTPDSLFVITSGTTGQPKLIRHSVSSLNTFLNVTDLEPLTWFVPAPVGSFAWYQMIFLHKSVERQKIVLTNAKELTHDFEIGIKDFLFDALSCTPTFIRYISMTFDRKFFEGAKIKRLTLGGEVIQKSDLDLAAELFPGVKINHIYAASEIGPIFTSSDTKPGYSLNKYRQGIDFKLEDEMLFVKNRLRPSMNEWYKTGDCAVINGDRLMILGRQEQDFINVGGNRVGLKRIEEVILKVPGILWARAYGVKSRLMGDVVGVEVMVESEANKADIEFDLNCKCLEILTDYEIPCEVVFVESIQLKGSHKK